MLSPRRVKVGNFTGPERTPWGGHRILSKYKSGLSLNVDVATRIGESWEVSTEPSFPSILEGGDRLADAIALDPIGWLGRTIAESYQGENPLLVKLIDSGTTLSVQVHPREDHEMLAPDESGKTEAWIVLEADPDAVIYLGFVAGVTQAVVEGYVAAESSLEPLLNRVPVQPGDVFVIRPGLVHALGAGVTVLEPQRVRPGRRTVTYRLWDWNRTFDRRGELSRIGKGRPLHVRESLAVTDWSAVGTALRQARVLPTLASTASSERPSILVDEPELFVQEYRGTFSTALPDKERMLAVLCLSGQMELTSAGGALRLRSGETCVVPAQTGAARLALSEGRAMVVCVQR
jgi:mannose-6-phosphate isomerase